MKKINYKNTSQIPRNSSLLSFLNRTNDKMKNNALGDPLIFGLLI